MEKKIIGKPLYPGKVSGPAFRPDIPQQVPQYLSTFDLEEARFGQVQEKCQIHLPPEWQKLILRKIQSTSLNLEFALSEFLKEKEFSEEIKNKVKKLLFKLLYKEFSQIPSILIAKNLTTNQMELIDEKMITGLLLEEENPIWEIVQWVRKFSIPAIFSLGPIASEIKSGDLIAMDGKSADVFIHPSQ